MLAVRARFDGKKIIIPPQIEGAEPGEVIVIFGTVGPAQASDAWMKIQEGPFAEAWDNDEDSVYDTL